MATTPTSSLSTAGAYGAAGGMALGAVTSIIGLRESNKSAISQINREGYVLQSHMRMINQNRETLDRELGDILSADALETAKNMATAKVLMSKSGTVGGTTSQVSKQAIMNQLLADADAIKQARNQELSLVTQAVSRQMNYRMQSDAIRSGIKSPLSAALGTLGSVIGMAGQGAMIGQSIGQALPASNTNQSTPQIGQAITARPPVQQQSMGSQFGYLQQPQTW